MKQVLMYFLLVSAFLSGCASAEAVQETMAAAESVATEVTEPTVAATVDWHDGLVVHDLDGDGNAEKLLFQDGYLRQILAVEEKGEQVIFEESSSFLCDDRETVVRFSEGSGGHTFFYYRLVNGEMKPMECLVYHYADDRYYRSMDCSGRDASLSELTEAEYRQAMTAFPCTEGKCSALGQLF